MTPRWFRSNDQLLLLPLVLLAGCRPKDTTASAFRWPAPSRFQVQESVRKTDGENDSSAVILHTFEFIPTNNAYWLRWLNVEYQSVNGQPVTSDEDKRNLEPTKRFYLE